MFGPLARLLWRPVPAIALRIEQFRAQQFAERFVVGVVLQGGAAQLANMLVAINADLDADRDGVWSTRTTTSLRGASTRAARREHEAAGGVADDALVRAADVRLFVVSRDHDAMRSVLRAYGNAPQLAYYAHRNYTAPGDEGGVIDMWLLSMCDLVYTTPGAIDTLGALFSRRPYVVQLDGRGKRGVADAQCQPCLSLSGIAKTKCYNKAMAFPEQPFKCEV